MRWITLFSLFVTGCAHSALTPPQRARLAEPADSYGTLIYSGTVTPKGEATPAFRYERRVRDNPDGTRISTHVTWAGAEPVVLQQATQDAAGRLVAFDEVHGQRGEVFHLDGGDVVVGPTLFEFVRTHLPELRGGRSVALELWSEGAGYEFALTLSGETVEMRAVSFFVGLAVAPIAIELGPDDQVVSYHGRIPPLFNGRAVDADVTYEYSARFR